MRLAQTAVSRLMAFSTGVGFLTLGDSVSAHQVPARGPAVSVRPSPSAVSALAGFAVTIASGQPPFWS